MKKCTNHLDRNTVLFCHGCGNPFCKECLVELGEHLYCSNSNCQQLSKTEQTLQVLPPEITCPSCSSMLVLEDEEQKGKIVHCTRCDFIIDFNVSPPSVKKPENYVELFSCMNVGDIAVIKSVLDDTGINYFVAGDNFAWLDPLVQPARFFVAQHQADDVKELLKDFKFHAFGVSIINEKTNESGTGDKIED